MIILLLVNCKESSAVIKLQMAHTGMSVKNRDRASDKVKEKLKLCGMFFGKMEMRFLVLSSFSHCKLKCQGYVFYSVHQFYNVFIKAREVK